MAPITEHDVRHIAKLAELGLTDAQVRQFTHQLGEILEYVEKLNELDTDTVEPLSHAASIFNVFRDDTARPGLGVGQVLANSKDPESPYFTVPKVLDQGAGA